MNYMGKRGRFILKAPFNTLAPQGAQGEVVEEVSIRRMISAGTDVLTDIYTRATAQALYTEHVNDDVTIIGIMLDGGGLIDVPVTHIEKLNDISLQYVTTYLTVRVGQLPTDYNYDLVKTTIADEVGKVSGVRIVPSDIIVGTSSKESVFYTPEEAALEESRRLARVTNADTDYARLLSEKKKTAKLEAIILDLEQKIIDLTG